MIYDTTGIFFLEGLRYPNLTAGGFLFHYIGGTIGSSPQSEFNLLIF